MLPRCPEERQAFPTTSVLSPIKARPSDEPLSRARVTERIPPGTVWMRDGWEGLNRLTSGAPAIPDEAVDTFYFAAGQAAFDAMVEVAAD
jgi:hypothetical protein